MKIVNSKEFFNTMSFGLLAIRQTTLGIKKSLEQKTRADKKRQIQRSIDAKKLMDTQQKADKEKLLEQKKDDGADVSENPIKKTVGSFWQRLITAIGWVLVGWLTQYLPKFLKIVKDVTEKIKKIIKAVVDVVQAVVGTIKEVWDVLAQFGENMLKGDWLDSEGKLRAEFREMEMSLGNSIDTTRKSFRDIGDLIQNYGGKKDAKWQRPDRRNIILPANEQKPIVEDGKNIFDGSEVISEEKKEELNSAPIGPDFKSVYNLIAELNGRNYNSVGNSTVDDLTSKTIGEVMKMEGEVGRYGFAPARLKTNAERALLTEDDVFDEKNQDKMAHYALLAAGINENVTVEKFEEIIERVAKVDIPEAKVEEAWHRFMRTKPQGGADGKNNRALQFMTGRKPTETRVVGYVGSTGNSTGPHIHIQRFPPPRDFESDHINTDHPVLDHIFVGGKPLKSWEMTSPPMPDRWGRPHYGPDYGGYGINGQPIQFSDQITYGDNLYEENPTSGEGNNILFTFGGEQFTIFHLSAGPDPIDIKPQNKNIKTSSSLELPVKESDVVTVPIPSLNNGGMVASIPSGQMVELPESGSGSIDALTLLKNLNTHYT